MFMNHKPIKWGEVITHLERERLDMLTHGEHVCNGPDVGYHNVSTKSQKWKYIISVHLIFATFRIGKG